MPTLVALISTGKGTWSEVNKVIQSQPWTKVFLITNPFGAENFKNYGPNVSLIMIDLDNFNINLVIEQIKKGLSGISDFEIALNFSSGSGKEHMALLEAVLELGLNFRIVALNTSGQMEVLGLKQ
ncbi:MAG: hypothetical protein WCV90_03380 [Candidatus Woesearchaeota archaeon]|jgi:hypothetical protein